MLIGLTYDLRQAYLDEGYSAEETAEFDREATIEAIEISLQSLGHLTDRIGHVRQLVSRLAGGDRWDLVFNIAEGLHGRARESQVPALLDAYRIGYTLSDPLVMAVCLDKGLTKAIVREAGVRTAAYRVIHSADDLHDVLTNSDLPYPLFAKPIAEGTGKGITPKSKVLTPGELNSTCRDLLETFRQPVLVETFLSGREFTTGILGTGKSARVLGTMEILLRDGAEPGIYSYVNKEHSEARVDYCVISPVDDPEVAAAETEALTAWRALGCRDAGRIDLRSDANGEPHFLEVNPLAGLHPEHSDLPMLCTALNMPYQELIRHIVDSA
ncbi:MAG: D-alanine--D-alanine ligase, partial [Planctomycetaceae bacterium]